MIPCNDIHVSVCSNVSQSEFKSLETIVKKIVKEKQPFERLEVTKEDLLEMFKVGLATQ